MIQLYSGPLSLFTAKVRIALAEKGVAYERIEVPFTKADGYSPKHPKVLELNPKAQVPVLVDGDGPQAVVLWDSTVILEYLEERFPTPALMPTDVTARARCRMLELHADEVFFAHVWVLIEELFYAGGNRERAEKARRGLAAEYAKLDAMLAERDWIGGDDLTTADLTYRLAALFATTLTAPPPTDRPALAAWLERIDARPSVAKELEGLAAAVASL